MSELRTLKRRYLSYLETQWGGSAKMIENYDRYIERFLTFSKVKKPSDITVERVAAFRLYLTKQSGATIAGHTTRMKQQTQNYYLSVLRMFLKYLLAEGFETVAPEHIKLAKISRRSLDLLSSTELERLRSAPDRKTIVGKRDCAIIELLCSTGLRISELCALDITDVDVTTNECSIQSTHSNQRLVFISDIALSAISTYLYAREDLDPALFIRYGRKANDGGDLRIHPRAIQRMLKVQTMVAGIDSLVTPQILRHTFADGLLKNGANLRSVQALLGHVTTNATRIYTPTTNPRSPKLR